MTYEPPSPPDELPAEEQAYLEAKSPGILREIATYAEALAEYQDRKARLEEEQDTQPLNDRPDDVPSKATVTIKRINDNRYYYWQWRDGEKVRSKYKGPVNDA